MKPLLMVHGISSNAYYTFGTPREVAGSGGGWVPASKDLHPDSMYHFLMEKGYTPGKDLFWYSYPTFRPLPELAGRLRREIAKAQQASGEAEIDLLTFSLGSIVSKYYVISPLYQKEVGKMIMIAPPFLGAPQANILKTQFIKSKKDLVLPGDRIMRAPWIMAEDNPLLKKMADTPFPSPIETTIIAMELEFNHKKKGLRDLYYRLRDKWAGKGDLTVPVKNTMIPVDEHIHLVEEFSLKNFHKFLPYHPVVKNLVAYKLGLETE